MPDDQQEFKPLERLDKSAAETPMPSRAGAVPPIVPSTGPEGPPRRRGWRVLLTGPVIFLGWIALFIAVVVGAVTLPDVFRGQTPRPRSLPPEPGPAAGEPPGPPGEPERPPRKKDRQDRLRPPQLEAVPVPVRGGTAVKPPPAPPPAPPPPSPPAVVVPPPPPPEVILPPGHHGLGHINGHDHGRGLKMGHVKGHGGHVGTLVPVPEAEFEEVPSESPGNGHVSVHGRGPKLGHDKWHGAVGVLVPVPEVEFADVTADPPGKGNARGHDKH